MKAIRVTEYGGPSVLKIDEIPVPRVGPSQVLVRNHAVGVNPVDTYLRSNTDNRGPKLPYTPGSDAAGVVEAVGPGVTAVAPGDRVYLGGTFTSIAGVNRSRLAHVRADGSLDGWNPQANGTVYALLASHGLVFAGGNFTTVDGQPRYDIAAIDPVTGHAVPWDTGATGAVYALAADDSSLYVGGAFTWIGAKARNRLAHLS